MSDKNKIVADYNKMIEEWHKDSDNDPECILITLNLELMEEVCKALMEKGITHEEFAKVLGVPRWYETKMMRCETKITLKMLIKIGIVLDKKWEVKLVDRKSQA